MSPRARGQVSTRDSTEGSSGWKEQHTNALSMFVSYKGRTNKPVCVEPNAQADQWKERKLENWR